MIMDENGKDAWAAVAKHVDPKSLLIADEHKAYDDLIGLVALTRVNHSLQYQEEDGTNSNVIETSSVASRRPIRASVIPEFDHRAIWE